MACVRRLHSSDWYWQSGGKRCLTNNQCWQFNGLRRRIATSTIGLIIKDTDLWPVLTAGPVIGDTAPMIIINTMVVEVTVLIVSSIDLVTNVLELRHVFLGICITDYQQTQ